MILFKILIEILIGLFAGYCCCYFISVETLNLKPQEVIFEYLKIIENKLKDNDKCNN